MLNIENVAIYTYKTHNKLTLAFYYFKKESEIEKLQTDIIP